MVSLHGRLGMQRILVTAWMGRRQVQTIRPELERTLEAHKPLSMRAKV